MTGAWSGRMSATLLSIWMPEDNRFIASGDVASQLYILWMVEKGCGTAQ